MSDAMVLATKPPSQTTMVWGDEYLDVWIVCGLRLLGRRDYDTVGKFHTWIVNRSIEQNKSRCKTSTTLQPSPLRQGLAERPVEYNGVVFEILGPHDSGATIHAMEVRYRSWRFQNVVMAAAVTGHTR